MSTYRGIPTHQFPKNIRMLFFKEYRCEIAQIALKTISELRERGVYHINGDDDATKAHYYNPVDTWLSANEMFEHWQRGFSPVVVNPSDCVEIFNTITLHLQQWVGYLNHGVQVSDAPVEELMALDRFADKVYVHAREERAKRNIVHFSEVFNSGNLGFNLNPLTQTRGQHRVYVPLGEAEGNDVFIDPKAMAKEERESFEAELIRLGGRHSTDMRAHERQSIFTNVDFKDKNKNAR